MKEILNQKLAEAIETVLEARYNPNRKSFGRTAVVNRIRGGKVQVRKRVSQTKGFKIVNGNLVRMSPIEMRNRKRAARISARKRKMEMSKILRKRRISMQRRKSRFGA